MNDYIFSRLIALTSLDEWLIVLALEAIVFMNVSNGHGNNAVSLVPRSQEILFEKYFDTRKH